MGEWEDHERLSRILDVWRLASNNKRERDGVRVKESFPHILARNRSS